MTGPLKSFWSSFFEFNWKFGLFLILLICIPRFVLVLQANASGNYGYIGLLMVISAVMPFIFLNKHGLKKIGVFKPKNYVSLLKAMAYGLLASFVLYAIGYILYNDTYQNWYQYIGNSYQIPATISPSDKNVLFAIMAITGMTFSPIGEELFFRGIVHASFAKSIGNTRASVVDSTAFALTHISHFGYVFIQNKWIFLITPTIIWVVSMFLVSRLFYYYRTKSDSILGAIVCHSAFNLGMIFCIFYLL